MVNRNSKTMVAAVALASCAWAGTASAGELQLYGQSIDFENSLGCLTIGDAISCSAPLLNVLAGLDVNADVPEGYLIPTPQGELRNNYIVVSGGGGSGANDGIEPITTPEVEDGFKSNDAQGDNFFATGQTSTLAGNLKDPDNNSLNDSQDLRGTWDVDIGWLIEALTFDEGRRQMLIGFDYNEPGGPDAAVSSLDYWALITVWDSTGESGKAPINFEIRSSLLKDPLLGLSPGNIRSYDDFETEKGIDSKPKASDFATVNKLTCVYKLGGVVVNVVSQPFGSCGDVDTTAPGFPSFDEVVTVDNASASNAIEFIAWVPELDGGLESFLLGGYDTISTRVLLGCFDNSSTDNKIGQGYLLDGTGATTNCARGGFPDIFLMAGDLIPTNEVPAPAPLLLIGVGLLGLTSLRWRARRRG